MGSAIIKNITLNMTMGNKSFLRIMIMMLRHMVMLEYVFDIKPDATNNKIVWYANTKYLYADAKGRCKTKHIFFKLLTKKYLNLLRKITL